jgi:hypothetical protein
MKILIRIRQFNDFFVRKYAFFQINLKFKEGGIMNSYKKPEIYMSHDSGSTLMGGPGGGATICGCGCAKCEN